MDFLEAVDILKGKEVSVTILETPEKRDLEGLCRSASAWQGNVDADELIKNIYADRLISTRPEPHL